MMKLNRKVEYALISLRYMISKAPGELTSAREISRQFGTPFDVTSRVLQLLGRKGILKSEQGSNGGYQIVKDLSRVNFRELMVAIMGPTAVVKCLQSDSCELLESCHFVGPAQYLNQKLSEFFEGLSVLEILESGAGVRPSGSVPEFQSQEMV